MFKKNKNSLLEATSESFDTYIGKKAKFHGRLIAEDSIRIDGEIFGNVEVINAGENITIAIGETGSVQGDIKSFRVLVAGKVEGNIYATEKVELHKTAEVKGDITYGMLGIEHGANVLGLMVKKLGNQTSVEQASDVIKKIQKDSIKK
jgi:cytoskeletal protein CcmA (bactofilin family)